MVQAQGDTASLGGVLLMACSTATCGELICLRPAANLRWGSGFEAEVARVARQPRSCRGFCRDSGYYRIRRIVPDTSQGDAMVGENMG